MNKKKKIVLTLYYSKSPSMLIQGQMIDTWLQTDFKQIDMTANDILQLRRKWDNLVNIDSKLKEIQLCDEFSPIVYETSIVNTENCENKLDNPKNLQDDTSKLHVDIQPPDESPVKEKNKNNTHQSEEENICETNSVTKDLKQQKTDINRLKSTLHTLESDCVT